MKWIKTTERKPEGYRNVILAITMNGEKFVGEGRYHSIGWVISNKMGHYSDKEVTHWMDFPKHPELEEGVEHERHS